MPLLTPRCTTRALQAAAASGIALSLLVACDRLDSVSGKPETSELEWARAALTRNPALEVVATDEQKGVFTVRVRSTGELRTVDADSLIADVPGRADAGQSPAGEAGTPPSSMAPSLASDPEAGAGTVASTSEPEPAAGAESGTQAESAAAPSGGEARIVRADTGEEVARKPAPGGRVLAEGPGYSISAGAPRGATGGRSANGRTASAAAERRSEPIICQGERFLQLDGRNIEFTGDAIVAERGCELHITNSRILAQGTAVIARAASVHIQNSSIEGRTASIEASGNAQVYLRSSHFRGLSRRLDDSALHDLGGNIWN